MRHGSDDAAVLEDWGAAHALDDAAGELSKFGISDAKYHAFVDVFAVHPQFLDLNFKGSRRAARKAENRCFSDRYLLTVGRLVLCQMLGQQGKTGNCTVDSVAVIFLDHADPVAFLVVDDAGKLAR